MMTITAPITVLDNGKIRVRINEIFKQVRSQVRTEIMLLKLVSSLVSTERRLFAPVSKCEVSSKVSTEKAIYNYAYHERKSLLLASIKILLISQRTCDTKDYHRICNKEINLTRISKVFTKIGKADNEFSDTLDAEFCDSLKKANYLADLANFSRQVAITHAEKLLFSFFACSFICSMSSWGKRTPFVKDLLFLYPVAIFRNAFINLVCKHYILKMRLKKVLTCICTLFYSVYAPGNYFRLYKTMPRSAGTLSRHLTTTIKRSNDYGYSL